MESKNLIKMGASTLESNSVLLAKKTKQKTSVRRLFSIDRRRDVRIQMESVRAHITIALFAVFDRKTNKKNTDAHIVRNAHHAAKNYS